MACDISDDASIELIVDAHATIGESPLWVAAERALYWVDIEGPALFRYDEKTGGQRRWQLPSVLGGYALIAEPPGALVALRDGIARLDFATGHVEPLAPAPFDTKLFRFNESACDPSGRFWIGVMFDPQAGDPPPQKAALHSFTFADGLHSEGEPSDLHNGMTWSEDGTSLHLSHSNSGTIWRYAVDPASGRLGARELFVEVPEQVGIPDGAALDAEGGYWCAIHGGSRLRRYALGGRLSREIMLPVSQPTMCAFGGEDMATLYVTSAADGLDAEALTAEPHAGGLFRLRPGIAGLEKRAFVR